MADFFGKGIGVAAGFDLGAAAPLDTRTVVSNMEELQAHIDGGRTYEGMLVYVEDLGKVVIVKKRAEGEGFETEDFGFNQEKFDEGLADTKQDIEDLQGADEELSGRIDVLEGLVVGGEGEGIAAILGDVADLKATVGDEQSGLVADMAAVQGRIDALEEIDHEAYIGAVDEAKELAQKGIDDAATAKQAAEAAQGAADKAQEEVDALEEKVAALEQINHEAFIAADEKVLSDAKEFAQQQIDVEKEAREAADQDIYDRLDTMEAIQHHDHENKEVLDGISAAKVQAWDGAEQAAKDYADQQIAALVDGAPEAMDTLKDLAQAIDAHQDVYEAYVDTVSAELAKKVDKVDGSRLVSEEEIAAWNAKAEVADVEAAQTAAEKVATDGDAALQAQIDALKGETEGSIAEQIGAAKEELQGKIDEVAGDVEEAAQAAAKAQEDATKGIEDAAKAQQAADAAQGAAEAAQGAAEAAQAQANKGVQDAQAAQEAADQAQQDVDALEELVGAPAKDDAQASGLFAEIAALKAKDIAIDEKDAAQDVRLAAIEEMMGLGGGEGDTSALDQFAQDIAGLKSAVGKNGETPTGLFAEIASLKTRDGELQGAVDAEAQRAKGEEARIEGLVDGLAGRMDNAEDAMAQAQEAIAGIQDTINKNAAADGEVKGRVDALETVVGKAAQGEEVATGLFAQIAALAAKNAAQDEKDAELAAAIGAPSEKDGQGNITVAATGMYAHIEALHNGVAETFATIKTEIGEDGKLRTSVAGTEVSATDVPVMEEEDITSVLADILGDAQPQE